MLDKNDIRILQLLQDDARLTSKEIADKIGKSVTPVYQRIKWLESEGYIQRYVAVLDKRKIGKNLTAYTHIQLKEHSQSMMQSFEKEVIKFSEVQECYHMSGQYDYLLKVSILDMDEYYDFMINRLAKLANVGNVQSFFVLFEAKQHTAYTLKIPEAVKNRKGVKKHSR